MRPGSVEADARIVLLAVPHPSSRRVAAYLESVLATAKIACELTTSPDMEPAPGETAIYLRSGSADAVELSVMADMSAPPELLAAHALVAHLDDRWRHVPSIAMELLFDRPDEALRRLARHLGQPFDESVYAAAETRLPSLLEDVALHEHPLAFLAAVDRGVDGGTAPATEPPRTMLALIGPTAPVERPIPGAEDRTITEIALQDASPERLAEIPAPVGVIHLHHVHGSVGLSELLERLMPRLAPRGQLSGEESAAAAAEGVVAQLTLRHNHRGLVFRLSGRDWQAAPPSRWR